MKNLNELNALLAKYNKNNKYETTVEDFERHAKRYLKAIKETRMICSIGKVSSSGMSRTLKFLEMPKNGGYLSNFYMLFDILGHTKVNNSDYFRIGGCGMDMVFATNYNIVRTLFNFGLCTAKTCKVLEQNTPQVV